jgi:signal transduction histidine kinase
LIEMAHESRSTRIEVALAALDLVLYERGETGELERISPTPTWFAASGANGIDLPRSERDDALHPFLAHFLRDAEAFWSSGRSGRIRSDAWSEARGEGTSDSFQATALALPGPRAILAIELVREFERERELPLQAARDSKLHLERLQKEIDKKEILLHCIVHDLKGPLAGMLGVLSLMKRHEPGPERAGEIEPQQARDLDSDRTRDASRARILDPERVRELAELGVAQARKQESMIQGILELFAAEISSLESFERDPARAPDLARAARNAGDMLRPAFEKRGIGLALDLPSDAVLVAGHPQRLERMLANLLENALRHAPSRSSVDVRIERRGALAYAAVEDRGAGVPESIRSQLFEKFVRDPSQGGTSGLGLYFCRMNVERWGGRIGCEPRDGGGTRFWFDLPLAVSP